MTTKKPKHGGQQRHATYLHTACITLALLAGFGCTPANTCSVNEDCPEGSHCRLKKNLGLCIWGKASAENPLLTVPDIRFRTELSPHDKTAKSSFKIQVDVYGAPKGTSTWFETPQGKQPLACTERVEAHGERRHLECLPKALVEGSHGLAVEASNAHTSVAERFAWSFEKRPLNVQLLLEEKSKRAVLRDDKLYVQLQADAGDIDLSGIELFAGTGPRQRALRTACQLEFGFPPLPNAVCFEVSLADFPELPHGVYGLELTAQLVDKEGNHAAKSQNFNIQVSRRLWLSQLKTHSTGVTTREGLLWLVTRQESEGVWKSFLVALDARGDEKYSQPLPYFSETGNLLLGNNAGMDVVLTHCSVSDKQHGFYVNNAQTGNPFSGECLNLQTTAGLPFALLQSGPQKNVVVVRRVLDSDAERSYLEACPIALWGNFPCARSLPLPDTWNNELGNILVRQVREGVARVFVSSQEQHWCAMEWSAANGWVQESFGGTNCIEEGPASTGWPEVQFLSAEHLWVSSSTYAPNNHWLTRFDKNAVLEATLNFGGYASYLLMDANNELIAGNNARLQRVSASGERLHEKTMWAYERGTGLMEGGELLFPAQDNHILCVKSDFSDCWPGSTPKESSYGQLLGIIPLSSTRSVAVFSEGDNEPGFGGHIAGFLIDSPGLKKDAPWPLWGHDLCRSNHANVPVDNCWDGPK